MDYFFSFNEKLHKILPVSRMRSDDGPSLPLLFHVYGVEPRAQLLVELCPVCHVPRPRVGGATNHGSHRQAGVGRGRRLGARERGATERKGDLNARTNTSFVI